jgi:AcrR family transcriptional regulator
MSATATTVTKPKPRAGARRAPLQERSQETVARALAAATALLARGVPLESMTTAQIAQEAGMSVGGLYRFFPDKQAVVDAIALRHMEEFQARVGAALLADFPDSPCVFLHRMIDAFVAYLEEHPDFRTLAFGAPGGGRYISRPTRDDYAGNRVLDMVMDFLSGAFDIEPSPDFAFRLRLATEIGDRLLAYSFEQKDPDARVQVVGEMKGVLGGYLFPEG